MAIGLIVIIIVAIVLVVGILIAWYVGTYNAFVALKADIPKALANIDVLLKQRHDELPKLIDTVKGYMKHERGTLTELTEARSSWMKAKTVQERRKRAIRLVRLLRLFLLLPRIILSFKRLRTLSIFKKESVASKMSFLIGESSTMME